MSIESLSQIYCKKSSRAVRLLMELPVTIQIQQQEVFAPCTFSSFSVFFDNQNKEFENEIIKALFPVILEKGLITRAQYELCLGKQQ